MARYYSHTIILPDETRLDDFVVEIIGREVTYFPFTGEIHSTVYVEYPILLTHRSDLQGKKVSLTQLTWALTDVTCEGTLYAYALTPCCTCAGERFSLSKL